MIGNVSGTEACGHANSHGGLVLPESRVGTCIAYSGLKTDQESEGELDF